MTLEVKPVMKIISVNIEESQFKKLEKKKKEKSRSVSEIIRHLIDKYLTKV